MEDYLYYSKILNKLFNSVEELKKAENDYINEKKAEKERREEAERIRKEKELAAKREAETIDADIQKAYDEYYAEQAKLSKCREKILELLRKKYGSSWRFRLF